MNSFGFRSRNVIAAGKALSGAWLAGTLIVVASVGVCAAAHADSTVYRCGPEGSQKYSQLPCEGASETIVIKEQHKLSDSDSESAGLGSANPGDAEPVNNAEAFVQQLEKQRREQLADIDRNIAELRDKAAAGADGGDDELQAEETAALLASLQNSRDAIVSEYDAMIRAAEQRAQQP